jgi:hypothetical protein
VSEPAADHQLTADLATSRSRASVEPSRPIRVPSGSCRRSSAAGQQRQRGRTASCLLDNHLDLRMERADSDTHRCFESHTAVSLVASTRRGRDARMAPAVKSAASQYVRGPSGRRRRNMQGLGVHRERDGVGGGIWDSGRREGPVGRPSLSLRPADRHCFALRPAGRGGGERRRLRLHHPLPKLSTDHLPGGSGRRVCRGDRGNSRGSRHPATRQGTDCLGPVRRWAEIVDLRRVPRLTIREKEVDHERPTARGRVDG